MAKIPKKMRWIYDLLLTAAIFDAKTTQQTETQLRSLATALAT